MPLPDPYGREIWGRLTVLILGSICGRQNRAPESVKGLDDLAIRRKVAAGIKIATGLAVR